MKITKLTVMAFEGLEHLEIAPSDSVTEIRGHNGAGKTSVLDAIRVAFTNKPTRSVLVRDDADNGMILFELDNGVTGERSVLDGGRSAGSMILHDEQGYEVSAAQRFLDKLGLGFGFNPLAFIDLKPEAQSKQLLEITPIDISLPELLALSGGQVSTINYHQHPLVVLKAIEDYLTEQRREAGRTARDIEGMAIRLREEVPVDFDRLAAQSFDLSAAVTTLNTINHTVQETDRLTNEVQRANDKIAALRQQIADLEARREEYHTALQALHEQSETLPDSVTVQADISAYKHNQLMLNRLNEADQRDAEAAVLRTTYTELTEQVEAVRAKPAQLLSHTQLPVQGLGINTDGQVTINGLPISALSTGEQLNVAVDIAIATLGDLKVVLVDGMERLDEVHQSLMLSRLIDAGVQAFITKVNDSELTILTDTVDESEVPF